MAGWRAAEEKLKGWVKIVRIHLHQGLSNWSKLMSLMSFWAQKLNCNSAFSFKDPFFALARTQDSLAVFVISMLNKRIGDGRNTMILRIILQLEWKKWLEPVVWWKEHPKQSEVFPLRKPLLPVPSWHGTMGILQLVWSQSLPEVAPRSKNLITSGNKGSFESLVLTQALSCRQVDSNDLKCSWSFHGTNPSL